MFWFRCVDSWRLGLARRTSPIRATGRRGSWPVQQLASDDPAVSSSTNMAATRSRIDFGDGPGEHSRACSRCRRSRPSRGSSGLGSAGSSPRGAARRRPSPSRPRCARCRIARVSAIGVGIDRVVEAVAVGAGISPWSLASTASLFSTTRTSPGSWSCRLVVVVWEVELPDAACRPRTRARLGDRRCSVVRDRGSSP